MIFLFTIVPTFKRKKRARVTTVITKKLYIKLRNIIKSVKINLMLKQNKFVV